MTPEMKDDSVGRDGPYLVHVDLYGDATALDDDFRVHSTYDAALKDYEETKAEVADKPDDGAILDVTLVSLRTGETLRRACREVSPEEADCSETCDTAPHLQPDRAEPGDPPHFLDP